MIGKPERAERHGSIRSAGDSQILAAARALANGEVIAIPTDTVYGLASRIDRPESIERLYRIKSRPANKAIPVLLDSVSHVELVTESVPPLAIELAWAFWPGALTVVVNARDGLPAPLTAAGNAGQRTVAVRVPDLDLARQIIGAAGGALAVTSANLSGGEPATTAAQVKAAVGHELGMIVDGGSAHVGVPSTIVDASGPVLEILRLGAITAEAIREMLGVRTTHPGQGRAGAV